jgi:hypothetical protein
MRPATDDDLSSGLCALLDMREKNPDKQMQWADPMTAAKYMTTAADEGRAVVVDGFLILFTASPLWFTKARFLIEELVIRLPGTSGPVESVTTALESLRNRHACVAIVTGDTQVGRMTPHYLAAGYKVLGQQFIKE